MAITVSGLFIYPIKSCAGIELQTAVVTRAGFKYDRSWMVVDSSGQFLTQRKHAKLALVRTALSAEALVVGWGGVAAAAALTATADGMPPLHVALQPPSPLPTRAVKCWEWNGMAYDEGDDAAQWFTTFLDMPCRLVRHAAAMPHGSVTDTAQHGDGGAFKRPLDPQYANGEALFSDGYPVLVISQPSLDDLNERLASAVPMNRFRPNIVVHGCAAQAEDNWSTLSVPRAVSQHAALQLHSVKPCARCIVTCTNQMTAEVGKEPLRTIMRYRSKRTLGWRNAEGDGFFGWNLVPNLQADQEAVLHVGDEVAVTIRDASVA